MISAVMPSIAITLDRSRFSAIARSVMISAFLVRHLSVFSVSFSAIARSVMISARSGRLYRQDPWVSVL